MRDESSNGPCRRQFLATAAGISGVTALSGCAALVNGTQSQAGATDVVAYNAAAEPVTVELTITDADAEESHTERTLDLDPGEEVDPVNQSKLPTNAAYTVDVSVENGPSETFDWEDPAVERAPLWVFVDGTGNIKFLLQAG